jgi:PTS system nitrogen regulatory IIA component
MRLTIKDLTSLLNVSEKTIRRWIKEGNIPAYRINGQYRFNRTEILEWSTSRRINVSAEIFQEPESSQAISLSDALRAGGIYYRLSGKDKTSAFKAVVEIMRLPEDADREYLLNFLLARESMASTGIGDGIAIPHLRDPIVLHVPNPMITLCFLEKAIDFLSLDGLPVYCLFTLVAPTVRSHLYLLSRLSFALKDLEFKQMIKEQRSREEIMQKVLDLEAAGGV